jgi:hypothetical protein
VTAPRLGWWWVSAVVLLAGAAIFTTGQVRLAGYVVAAGLGVGALLRLVLPSAHSGGLGVRSRGVDVVTMTVLALALAVITYTLNLDPRL